MDILANHSVTLISIILGLGLTELLGNLFRLIRDRKRVRWDALPLAWTAFLLLGVVNYWWSLTRGYAGSQQLNSAGEFALLLAPPLLLFFGCASALPKFEPGQAADMPIAYSEQRRVLLLVLALAQISSWASQLLMRGFYWDGVGAIRTTILALFLIAFFANSRRVDWAALGLALALIIFRIFTQPVR